MTGTGATGRIRRSKAARRVLAAIALVLVAGMAVVAALTALEGRDEAPVAAAPTVFSATPLQVARGAYLALAGNCAGCHTARGGAPFAGGQGIETPFGTVYASNLTPDRPHGIGAWTSDDFWRALHHGRSRGGRLLYPAFPYPSYSEVTRPDADSLFAYLRSLAPVAQANTPNTLRFPYDRQAALAVWRAVYFRPRLHRDDPGRSAEWNRGSYLVRGLGHCAACHAPRNRLGASSEPLELNGGLIPVQNWYAPSLHASDEAGLAGGRTDDTVELLRTGRSRSGWVSGPMADVVYRSTQYLTESDLRSIAVFLEALPGETLSARSATGLAIDVPLRQRGADIYRQRCAACHGEQGQGAAGAYPPLAGNRAVLLAASPANLVQLVVHGGYLPSTAGNPRPYGMPPFGAVLDDAEIAAVVTYVRNAWGNSAPAVSTLEVLRLR